MEGYHIRGVIYFEGSCMQLRLVQEHCVLNGLYLQKLDVRKPEGVHTFTDGVRAVSDTRAPSREERVREAEERRG